MHKLLILWPNVVHNMTRNFDFIDLINAKLDGKNIGSLLTLDPKNQEGGRRVGQWHLLGLGYVWSSNMYVQNILCADYKWYHHMVQQLFINCVMLCVLIG